jgi:predicted nuclease of restriction endonuclease-like (RecB) superfamily
MKKKVALKAKTAPSKALSVLPVEDDFAEIVNLIQSARRRAVQAVNTELIDLYWRIGDYLHQKIKSEGWAKGTVVQLAACIAQREPGLRGFSPQNLWRMRQFFETYSDHPKLSPLLRVLPWSSHLHILSRAKRAEEREFYLRMATQNRWSVSRAAYGERILATVSRELTAEFGGGFGYATVNRAIQFAQFFPNPAIVSTLSTQLSWSHFIELLPIKDPLAREFYAEMCRVERWDVRTLRLKIGGMLFQRTALSSGAKYCWMSC